MRNSLLHLLRRSQDLYFIYRTSDDYQKQIVSLRNSSRRPPPFRDGIRGHLTHTAEPTSLSLFKTSEVGTTKELFSFLRKKYHGPPTPKESIQGMKNRSSTGTRISNFSREERGESDWVTALNNFHGLKRVSGGQANDYLLAMRPLCQCLPCRWEIAIKLVTFSYPTLCVEPYFLALQICCQSNDQKNNPSQLKHSILSRCPEEVNSCPPSISFELFNRFLFPRSVSESSPVLNLDSAKTCRNLQNAIERLRRFLPHIYEALSMLVENCIICDDVRTMCLLLFRLDEIIRKDGHFSECSPDLLIKYLSGASPDNSDRLHQTLKRGMIHFEITLEILQRYDPLIRQWRLQVIQGVMWKHSAKTLFMLLERYKLWSHYSNPQYASLLQMTSQSLKTIIEQAEWTTAFRVMVGAEKDIRQSSSEQRNAHQLNVFSPEILDTLIHRASKERTMSITSFRKQSNFGVYEKLFSPSLYMEYKSLGKSPEYLIEKTLLLSKIRSNPSWAHALRFLSLGIEHCNLRLSESLILTLASRTAISLHTLLRLVLYASIVQNCNVSRLSLARLIGKKWELHAVSWREAMDFFHPWFVEASAGDQRDLLFSCIFPLLLAANRIGQAGEILGKCFHLNKVILGTSGESRAMTSENLWLIPGPVHATTFHVLYAVATNSHPIFSGLHGSCHGNERLSLAAFTALRRTTCREIRFWLLRMIRRQLHPIEFTTQQKLHHTIRSVRCLAVLDTNFFVAAELLHHALSEFTAGEKVALVVSTSTLLEFAWTRAVDQKAGASQKMVLAEHLRRFFEVLESSCRCPVVLLAPHDEIEIRVPLSPQHVVHTVSGDAAPGEVEEFDPDYGLVQATRPDSVLISLAVGMKTYAQEVCKISSGVDTSSGLHEQSDEREPPEVAIFTQDLELVGNARQFGVECYARINVSALNNESLRQSQNL